ncbi:MAG: DUF7146 domain-containing protein [Rhodanobacter sp.]
MRRFNMADVRRLTDGQWDRIFSAVLTGSHASGVADAFARMGKHGPCPVHGGRDGFRIDKNSKEGLALCETCTAGKWKDGFATIMWMEGMTFPEAVEEVLEVVAPGYSDSQVSSARRESSPRVPAAAPVPTSEDVAKERKENIRRRDKLKEVWKASFSLHAPESEIARKYFQARGLETPKGLDGELRFVPSLTYFDGAKVAGSYPALVAMVRNHAGQSITLHRTYLSADGLGKAPVEDAKKLMAYPTVADLRGAAIRLGEPQGESLGVAEGMETALAVQALTGEVCWSCVNATLLEQFKLPAGVNAVWVWGDKDLSGRGQEAATALVKVLREDGHRAMEVIPPWPVPKGEKGIDWLDVYCTYGAEAIAMVEPFRRVMGKGIGQRILGVFKRVTG